jgi:uncharacterized protein YyaL (SSP411 family)
LLQPISRAGEWFLASGIQELSGGVARYYRTDLERNAPVSTEITGYTASALAWLHGLTGESRYLDRARAAARFLADTWRNAAGAMPFELTNPAFAYFFDSGIIVRGLLAVWRATGDPALLETAAAIGRHMAADHAAPDGFHPILALPGKQPVARDALRWSASPGCYQLKSAMAWLELACATSDPTFREPYDRVLDASLASYAAFLPGHPDRIRVMDRLHAFSYFLEGLLPVSADSRCRAALADGIARLSHHLRAIAPDFERSDVYAQLLRVRVLADRTGAVPLDRASAQREAVRLAEFQASDGGWNFGFQSGEWLPYRNPVSTAFAVQALALWDGAAASVTELI